MPYTPDVTDVAAPADTGVPASTAASEFRAIKLYIRDVLLGGYAKSLKTATTFVAVDAAAAPSVGQVLMATSSTAATWQTPAAAGGSGDMILADVQSVTGLKTFDTTKLGLKGSSTGSTAFASANASATNYTITFPAVTGTVAMLGANTFTADQNYNNFANTGIKHVGFFAEYNCGNSATAVTVTLANGQKQKLTLTGNATVTISLTGALVGAYQLRLIQDATGGRTVTWSGLTATRWLGATSAPAINAAVNGETIITMYYDGANLTQSAAKVGAV